MNRLVTSNKKGLTTRQAAQAGGSTQLKDQLERIAKYIPAEIIAAFTGINAALSTLPDNIKLWAFSINLIGFWIVTPFYFKWVATLAEKPSVTIQQWVSSLAYIIWVYTFTGENGVFGTIGLNIYYPGLASALIIFFSFISGFIIPKA